MFMEERFYPVFLYTVRHVKQRHLGEMKNPNLTDRFLKHYADFTAVGCFNLSRASKR